MIVKVSVTHKHIEEGRKTFFSLKCPIGLALADSGIKNIGTFYFHRLSINKESKCDSCGHIEKSTNWIKFPESVTQFLDTLKLNTKAPVEPFTFELDIP